jgi:hypothetical protein
MCVRVVYMCVVGVNYVPVCVLGSYICVLWVLIMSMYICVRGGRIYVC